MADKEDRTWVNTLLEADRLRELDQVREHYGIESRSEAVRFCIRAAAVAVVWQPPAVRDIIDAWAGGLVDAEEAIRAIAGRGQVLA